MNRFSIKNKFIYVVIMCDKPRFITAVNTEDRTAEWKATGTPYKFHSWDDANYVCLGLMWRGTWAFPVVSSYEMKEPFYKEVENEEKDRAAPPPSLIPHYPLSPSYPSPPPCLRDDS